MGKIQIMEYGVVVIGAGAAGLMCSRELAKNGKKVVILEVRDRVGGRVWEFDDEFGLPVQGGAEFVHGDARITQELMHEAGLTYTEITGETWNFRDGKFTTTLVGPHEYPDFIAHQGALEEALTRLQTDVPLAQFLRNNFADERYAALRAWAIDMASGYDAADPERISTFALREEWLAGGEWKQGRIQEGYGSLMRFLQRQCKQLGIEIRFHQEVVAIEIRDGDTRVTCADGNVYRSEKVVVTVPLRAVSRIQFTPAIPRVMDAITNIGSGNVIKILLKFRDHWWIHARGKDFSKMVFMLSQEEVPTWWTQYPDPVPLLTGWLSGPAVDKYIDASDEDILNVAYSSLEHIFGINSESIRKYLLSSRVVNWPRDPFSQGAYSYPMLQTEQASMQLRQPIENTIFFAGEAIYSGSETAMVEGALGSGKETASNVMKEAADHSE